jgi:hypothetical protein
MLYFHRTEFSDERDRAGLQNLLWTTVPTWRKSPMLDAEQFSEMCVELIFWIDAIPDYWEEWPDFWSVFRTAGLNRYSRWWRRRQRHLKESDRPRHWYGDWSKGRQERWLIQLKTTNSTDFSQLLYCTNQNNLDTKEGHWQVNVWK